MVALNGSPSIASPSTTPSLSTNDSVYDHQKNDDQLSSVVVVLPSDDVMDLLRAIEMSRLQAVREHEQNTNRTNTNNNTNNLVSNTNDKIDYFNDLQQAIELSIKTKNTQQSTCEATCMLLINVSFIKIPYFKFNI